MDPLQLVKLDRLMSRSSGRAEVVIGLIDGPVAMDHPELTKSSIREVTGRQGVSCSVADSVACMHGTFVAGILSATRDSSAPAICPDCTLLVRPIFPEQGTNYGQMPSATPDHLAMAIEDVVQAGAKVINLSAALVESTAVGLRRLQQALDFSASRNAIVVAAAGNQAAIGSTVITRHAWVLPVVGCDRQGFLKVESNLGRSIGHRGLAAPGQNITSLGPRGGPMTFSGTSAAAPFVTGTIALLWSEFPGASANRVRLAVTHANGSARTGIIPPLIDAWRAHLANECELGQKREPCGETESNCNRKRVKPRPTECGCRLRRGGLLSHSAVSFRRFLCGGSAESVSRLPRGSEPSGHLPSFWASFSVEDLELEEVL